MMLLNFTIIVNILERNINLNIIIKPHHLLDIFKLYGKGLENFIPDKKYNHDFYLIGNSVIENKVDEIQFTHNHDDICKPCKYLKNNICIDRFSYNNIIYGKNDYNEKLDIRLIHLLGIDDNKTYKFKDIIYLINKKISLELINLVWYSSNKEDNEIRYNFTKKGIEKYILKYHL